MISCHSALCLEGPGSGTRFSAEAGICAGPFGNCLPVEQMWVGFFIQREGVRDNLGILGGYHLANLKTFP